MNLPRCIVTLWPGGRDRRVRAAVTGLCLFVLVAVNPTNASATSISSESSIFDPTGFLFDSGVFSSGVSEPFTGNSASSFNVPTTETMGAFVSSDGTAFDVKTSTSVGDDWFCSGSCAGLSLPLSVSLTASFDAVISGPMVSSTPRGYFDVEAKYVIGSEVFQVGVGADSTPLSASASFGGAPVDVVLTTDTSGNVHVSAVATGIFICPCFSPGTGPIFSDLESLSIDLENASGTIDASHTFSVTLTPLDSSISLTSANGRTAGSAPAPAPVPEPATLMLLGTGLAVLARSRTSGRRH